MSDTQAGKPSVATAEISVCLTSSEGVTGMTPEDFIAYLKANGYRGNTSFNDSKDKAWIGFWNDK